MTLYRIQRGGRVVTTTSRAQATEAFRQGATVTPPPIFTLAEALAISSRLALVLGTVLVLIGAASWLAAHLPEWALGLLLCLTLCLTPLAVWLIDALSEPYPGDRP